MKISLTQFVTLDGVSQGPGSPTEDTSDDFTIEFDRPRSRRRQGTEAPP